MFLPSVAPRRPPVAAVRPVLQVTVCAHRPATSARDPAGSVPQRRCPLSPSGPPLALAACPTPRSSAAPARSTACWPRPTPTPAASSTSTTPSSCSSSPCCSAQTTDRRVNAVRPTLFAAYPDAAGDGRAPTREKLEQIIGPLGFFRAKTESLLKLVAGPRRAPRRRGAAAARGPGRRCPAWAARPPTSCSATRFGIPGITVDTHFGRLARRFGWTEETDPVKVEHEVGALFPKQDWTMLSHHLIWHGRRVCHARNPACGACPWRAGARRTARGRPTRSTAAKLVKTEGRA